MIEKVLTAYTDEHINAYTETAFKNGIEEHGYPRLTAHIGILIAHGRKPEYKEKFRKTMDFCCKEFTASYLRNGHYNAVAAKGKNRVSLKISIDKI